MAIHNAMQVKMAEFKAVVQAPLLPGEVPKVMGYLATPETLFEMLEILASTGYEVSLRHDKKRKNHSVCIKGAAADCLNAGLWLYGNGETLHNAFCSALYKHFEIFQQGRWEDRDTDGSSAVS